MWKKTWLALAIFSTLLSAGIMDDFKKACDGGFAQGCFNLGLMYAKGMGVRQNRTIAKEYFGKACDLGYQRGCKAYRELNEQGY
jgi:TPR repeat protein